jgi:5S rRNA maturation endonuclease (ribonuclease M5)
MKPFDREREARTKGTFNLEALEELISELLEASSRGAAIIVEGQRDGKSLRALGACGPLILASRRPAIELSEEAARDYEELIILTDWDRKGEEMAALMEKHLRADGAKPDVEIRDRLKKLVRKEIKDVESLYAYIERMRELS